MENNRKKQVLEKLNSTTQIVKENHKEQIKIIRETEEEAYRKSQNLSKELRSLTMEEVESIYLKHLPINHSLF